MYVEGLGVTKSITVAKYWLKKAADQGNQKAIDLLKELDTEAD